MNSIGPDQGLHGTLMGGAQLSEAGYVELDGVDDYVDLPNGIISSLVNATFMAWVAWEGEGCWQRIFDFGTSTHGEDFLADPEDGTNPSALYSLYVSTQQCDPPDSHGLFGLRYQNPPNNHHAVVMHTEIEFPKSANSSHVALVVDDSYQEYRLYLEGENVGTSAMVEPLRILSDDNNWLGRSQFSTDPTFQGRYYEFRIYPVALSDEQVKSAALAGPDVLN